MYNGTNVFIMIQNERSSWSPSFDRILQKKKQKKKIWTQLRGAVTSLWIPPLPPNVKTFHVNLHSLPTSKLTVKHTGFLQAAEPRIKPVTLGLKDQQANE